MYNKKHFRSRRRGYVPARRNSVKPNYLLVVFILCISVGCGYATAKYVVDPVVNYVPQTSDNETQEITIQTSEKITETANILEDSVAVKETGEILGYSLQFGCYSSNAAAEAAKKNIKTSGLQILEQNNMYKIVGEIYSDKEKAKKALNDLPDTNGVFITTIYK